MTLDVSDKDQEILDSSALMNDGISSPDMPSVEAPQYNPDASFITLSEVFTNQSDTYRKLAHMINKDFAAIKEVTSKPKKHALYKTPTLDELVPKIVKEGKNLNEVRHMIKAAETSSNFKKPNPNVYDESARIRGAKDVLREIHDAAQGGKDMLQGKRDELLRRAAQTDAAMANRAKKVTEEGSKQT